MSWSRLRTAPPPPPPAPPVTGKSSPGLSLLWHELVQVEGHLLLASLLQLGLDLHHQGLGDAGQEDVQDAGLVGIEWGVPFLLGSNADDAVVHGGQGRHRQQVGQHLGLDVRQHATEYRHDL